MILNREGDPGSRLALLKLLIWLAVLATAVTILINRRAQLLDRPPVEGPAIAMSEPLRGAP